MMMKKNDVKIDYTKSNSVIKNLFSQFIIILEELKSKCAEISTILYKKQYYFFQRFD
jgi:hypothetical protein